jgi:hypothetical protein
MVIIWINILFIIPDIFITFVVLFSLIRWFKVLIWTIIWALVWGTIMYLFWKYDINSALNFLNLIPFINEVMLEYAKNTLINDWLSWIIRWSSDWIHTKFMQPIPEIWI